MVYTLIWRSFGGMESETMLTLREKSPLPEAQRRFEPVMLNHTGQQPNALPIELFRPHFPVQFSVHYSIWGEQYRLCIYSCFCNHEMSRSVRSVPREGMNPRPSEQKFNVLSIKPTLCTNRCTVTCLPSWCGCPPCCRAPGEDCACGYGPETAEQHL